jgi:hypothetical protein
MVGSIADRDSDVGKRSMARCLASGAGGLDLCCK